LSGGSAGVTTVEVDRSLGGRRWRFRPSDDRLAARIAQQTGLDESVARVLAGRGIAAEDVDSFLNPTLRESLPDPSDLRDMDVAAERIVAAILSGESMTVFGDYDVDGATSSALLKRFCEAVGGRLRIYIPDRITEGYGPNAAALERLAAEGVSLVITVDCGTLSFAPLEAAAAAGLEVVVIDHHKAGAELPQALAVVNPNRLDEDGSLGQLAAVGVTFLLVIAVNRALRRAGWYRNRRAEPDLRQWLDLVALGTVCDVVPLTGPNRAFVAQGLRVMARRRNAGLVALSDVARLSSAPAAYHLGFLLGPRVNAGGRVGESMLGASLLTCDDAEAARGMAERLDMYNAERQALEAEVEAAAQAMLVEAHGMEGPPSLAFAAGEGWHPGVIGIVASRLVERFGCPAVIIGIDDRGEAKGSARSISGVDIGAVILDAVDHGLIEKGGGHAMAAGLTARRDQLSELSGYLEERLRNSVAKAQAGRVLELDGSLSVGGCTPDLAAALEALGPFGIGNPSPRFVLPRVEVVKADIVGEKHVRAFLAGGDGARLKAIAFRAVDSDMGQALLRGVGQRFHVAGRLKQDDWGVTPRAELTLDDLAHA